MSFEGILTFMWLSFFLGISTFIKRKIKFFQNFLIPNAIIAGFLLLICGREGLKIINFSEEILGNIVYHLLAIGFISLALKEREVKDDGKYTINTAFFITSTYILQGIVGLIIFFIIFFIGRKDVFPGLGLLLPLGYGQGPGQAYSIGMTWEKLGVYGASSLGLAIATFGFLWACIPGVIYLNYRVKYKKEVPDVLYIQGNENNLEIEKDKKGDIPLSESIDRLTVQIFLIGLVYLITYYFLKGLEFILNPLGPIFKTLMQTFWGFHFIFGTIFAIFLRLIFNFMKKKKIMVRNYPNNFLLQRVSGASFDYLIAASIGAISIGVLKYYLVPLLIVTTVGGFLTYYYCSFLSKIVYNKFKLEFTFILYGNLTGTISTGLALLREIDPDFKSPAANSLVFGSGIALFIGFPLLFVLNLPLLSIQTGKIKYLYISLIILILYIVFLKIVWFILLKSWRKSVN
ncbi:MAG: sodium:glutamate symporter [Spirochaetes bacterium]|nr:sodium:glutamate symporter [Spirochaetota bacterium]